MNYITRPVVFAQQALGSRDHSFRIPHEHKRCTWNSKHSNYMRFKTLDLEEDPMGQGFETNSYDIVIAGSVGSL
ncbi:hypothetical protein RRF57_007887 [Xylaria bambusicola]|uniref:Uncharacterized protein n=1 Tax=Xylaria bambusicola TaxID=326684 RepID=A0AAN7ULU5_9PEZI